MNQVSNKNLALFRALFDLNFFPIDYFYQYKEQIIHSPRFIHLAKLYALYLRLNRKTCKIRRQSYISCKYQNRIEHYMDIALSVSSTS